MSDTRRELLDALHARATLSGRKVYGYCSAKAGCEVMPRGGVPAEWDRVCCEGDAEWTRLPTATPAASANPEAA